MEFTPNSPVLINDQQAQQEASGGIKNIPHYSFEHILSHALAPTRKAHLSIIGRAQAGVVLGLSVEKRDWSAKLFRGTFQVNLNSSMIGMYTEEDTILDELNAYSPPSQLLIHAMKDEIELQILGHGLEPNYVDSPEAVLTWDHAPIGYILPRYQGQPITTTETIQLTNSKDFQRAIENLNRYGISIDDAAAVLGGGNIFTKKKTLGGWEIKVIDLRIL